MIPEAAAQQPSHRHERNFFKKSGTLKIAVIWKAVTRQERVTSKQLEAEPGSLSMMRELTDNELDLVGGGANQGQNGTGLVVVGAQIGDVTVTDVLSHNAVLNNSLNGNTVQVPIGVAVAVLSGATGVLQHLGL